MELLGIPLQNILLFLSLALVGLITACIVLWDDFV